MKIKNIIGNFTFLICGMVNEENNLEKIKYIVQNNKHIIDQCKNLVVILNKSPEISDDELNKVFNLYKTTFKNCIILRDHINRGHQIGHVDLDKTSIFFIKNNLNTEYTLKASIDVLLSDDLLNIDVDCSDFIFLPAACINDIYTNQNKIEANHNKKINYDDSQPHYQTWFYILKNKYDDVFESNDIIQMNFDEWVKKGYKDVSQNLVLAAEHSLIKFTIKNNIKRCSLMSEKRFHEYIEFIKKYSISDGSMKNIFFVNEGILHWHNKNIVQINF